MADTDTRLSPQAADFITHARTYHRFATAVKWAIVVHAAVISTLVLFFATGASFLGSLVVGLIIFGLGAYAMRHGLAHSSEANAAPPELTRPPA